MIVVEELGRKLIRSINAKIQKATELFWIEWLLKSLWIRDVLITISIFLIEKLMRLQVVDLEILFL